MSRIRVAEVLTVHLGFQFSMDYPRHSWTAYTVLHLPWREECMVVFTPA